LEQVQEIEVAHLAFEMAWAVEKARVVVREQGDLAEPYELVKSLKEEKHHHILRISPLGRWRTWRSQGVSSLQ